MTAMSRRQFFMTAGAGAAAAGAAWRLHPRSSMAEAATDDHGGFRMSIQTNILNAYTQDLEEIIAHTADLEIPLAEFPDWHYELTLDEDRIAEVQAMLGDHGVEMAAYFLGEIEEDSEDALRPVFEFARLNGASVLIGQPTEASFPILHALVREYTEMRVAIHNYGPGHRFDLTEDMLTAAAPWDWRIGYCLDTGHLMRSGENPVEAVRRMGSRLYGLHLREHAEITRNPDLPETIVGEGALDLEGLCEALRDVQFTGPLSLEIYYNPAEPLDAIRRSMANFLEAARATA